MTVERGRILSDRTIAIQDGTSGIYVRLAREDGSTPVRGDIIRVHRRTGRSVRQLEIRPVAASDVAAIGSGGSPEPRALNGSSVDESTEGSLAATTSVVVAADRRKSGAISVTVRDDTGEYRVYLHAGHGVSKGDVARGRRLSVVGLVGQRASRSGKDDGHRIWPRDAGDVTSRRPAEPQA